MAKKNSNNVAAEIGLAVASVAAAAGAVFLFGTKAGKQKQKQVKAWSLKAKAEVLEKIEKMKEVNEEAYNKVVDAVTEKYAKVKDIEGTEVQALVADLKKSWKDIKKIASPKKIAKVKKAIVSKTKNA